MAKLLQPSNSGAAPRRVTLKTSGPAPKTTLRLKGADGKAIEPKKTPRPAASETPAPVAVPSPVAAPTPVAAPNAKAEAAAKAAAEAAARKAAEEEAARKAAEEEAARKAAEEEAARLAQEEYERQMAEYEKQMEEYNRQMAEYQAAEEARLAAEAEEARKAEEAAATAAAPATKPKTKLMAAKPAGLKPATGLKPASAKPAAKKVSAEQPAAAPAPAAAKPKPKAAGALGASALSAKPKAKKKATPTPPVSEGEGQPDDSGLSEEELAARDAYLEQLQKQAEAPKIWQMPVFKYACGALGVLAVGIGIWAWSVNSTNKAIEEHGKYINQYLTIAQNLNKQGIETYADVKEKKVDFSCPPEAAKDLLWLVVDPFVKRADGRNKFGANPEGVAQNACLVLAIAAEQNPEIDKLIFATLGEKCDKMRPSLFSWLLQRMSISNNKGIKGKLKKLARQVAAKPKWKHKSQMLSSVWSCIGLRVTPKDLEGIFALLGDEAIDDQLAKTLSICIGNVLDMTEDPAEKQRIGDEVFDKLPEKYRSSIIDSLAKSTSPKALAFYKKEIEDPASWESAGQVRFAEALRFFQFYGSDDQVDYLLELKEKAADKPALLRVVEGTIQGMFAQNRERSDAEAKRLLDLIFDKLHEDTSDWDSIINKTDPDAADFVGESSPEYAKLMERKKALEECRQQKTQLINALSGLRDFKWVTNLLDSYAKDADGDIANKASRALDKVKENTANHVKLQGRYKARGKE